MKYTVLLLYPKRIAATYGESTYLAWVEADDTRKAEHKAKVEAGRANCTTGKDFHVLFVTKGEWTNDLKTSMPLKISEDELATDEEIKEARELYQTDDVEIDDGAKVSRAESEGLWVAAWVWLERREP